MSRKKRTQDCLVFTEDGRIVSSEMRVEKGYIVDHKTMEAWGLSSNSMVPKLGTEIPYLLLAEREFAPLPLAGFAGSKKFTDQEIDRIAAESCDMELAQIAKKSIRNRIADTVRLIAIIFAIMVVVLVAIAALSSGTLHT